MQYYNIFFKLLVKLLFIKIELIIINHLFLYNGFYITVKIYIVINAKSRRISGFLFINFNI